MNSYFKAEFPYSEELYHHGIKGQKWGIRRFQNPDGTLTALGKVHYGAQKAIKGTGKYIGKTAKRAGLSFVGKHARWLMSDEALQEYTKRLTLENNYYRAMTESKKSKSKEFIGDILYKAGDKLIGAGLDNMASNIRAKNAEKLAKRKDIFDSILEERKEKRKIEKEKKQITDWKDVLRNPEKHSDTDVNNAFVRLTKLNTMQKNADELNRILSDKHKIEKGKNVASVILVNAVKENTSTREWTRKTNPSFVNYNFLKESEERKKLYGPGGTAYR